MGEFGAAMNGEFKTLLLTSELSFLPWEDEAGRPLPDVGTLILAFPVSRTASQ